MVMKPHGSLTYPGVRGGGGGGESGFTLTGALRNFMFIPQELNEKGNSVDLSIRPK